MALVTLAPPSPTPDQVGAPAPRRLAAGTELLGVYEAAAFTQPQFLLRRGDGQVIQLTRLLYLVAAALAAAPNATPAVIAAAVAVELDRPVSADNVTYIIDHKLAPLGVIAADDPAAVPLTQARPMLLGLRFRARVVPARLHRGLSRALRPLFWPPVVAAVLAAFVGYDIWLGATRGAAILGGVQTVILHPDELLAIIAISVAVGFFHELGHATAARYGGATPGVMGVGIYLMMPVFYTDVTDSYRLGRRGRLRTDLGGLYFNAIAILAAAALYETTRSPLLLVFIGLSEFEMLYQFLPFIRMDGFYVLADLIGVPNLFAYMAPLLARLARRDTPAGNARLAQLTPRARYAITAWVAATVPILALNLAVTVVLAPRIFPALWTSAHTQATGLTAAISTAAVLPAANHLIELILVTVPAAGMAYILVTLAARIAPPLARTATRPLTRLTPHLRPGRHPRLATAAVTALVAIPVTLAVSYALHNPARPHPAPNAAAAPITARTAPARTAPAVRPAAPTPSPTAVGSAPTATLVSTAGPRVAATPDGHGYWLTTPTGAVRTCGDAPNYGSEAGHHLDAPVVAITPTPDGHGYWLIAADGGVFTFGDAHFYGSAAGHHLDAPVVAATPTPDGHGYWLIAADGGVFTFGDAHFYGSAGPHHLDAPVVAATPTPDGHGYWLTAADGGVFTFGDAHFYGSAAGLHLDAPVVAITPTPDGHGYRLIAAHGKVIAFGDAHPSTGVKPASSTADRHPATRP